LLLPYKACVHSITTDNGSEFAKHEYIAKRLQTTIYFTDPYSSWQKGCIENTNKLIRQYIPKKTNFAELTDELIYEI
jgi:IS30 family transposase